MPGGLGPRFALEAGFLILLAAVAVYARLDTVEIIAVMAGGWLLTAIFEVIAAARERLYTGSLAEVRVEERPAPAEPERKRRRIRLRRARTEEAEAEPKPEAPVPAAPALDDGASAANAPAPATSEERRPATEAPAPGTSEEGRPATEAPVPTKSEERRPATEAPAPAKSDEPAPEREAPMPAASPGTDDEATGEFALPTQRLRRWLRRRQAEAPQPEADAELEPVRPSARHVRLITGSTGPGTVGATPEADDGDQEQKDAGTAS
jgi:hypothetical protein